MIDLPLLILCLAAALCLGLNRLIATRVLGYGAAGAALLAALTLLVTSRRATLPIDRVFGAWIVPDTLVVPLALRLDSMSLALGLLVCCGGAVSLFTLALSVSASLRGFGTLFGWSLLVLAASFATICCITPLLLPYLWAIVALVSFAAVWSSGVLGRGAGVSPEAAYPLLAGPLLLIGVLPVFATVDSNATLVIGTGATICIVLAVLLAAGLPPFRGSLDTLLAGPAALGGLLSALGLPLAVLATVWRLIASATQPLAPFWSTALVVVGLLALLICAAGALREHALKALLGWQIGGQVGIVLIGLGLYRPGITGAESGLWALLSNFALTTLAGMLAVAVFERGGGDDFTALLDEHGTDTRALRLAGIAWIVAGGSAIGLPPFWGFWGRRWLVDAAFAQTPWIVPCVLMGSTLIALAYLAPLVIWFRPQSAPVSEQTDTRTSNARNIALCGLIPATICLLLGVAPNLSWLPLEIGRREQAVCVALVLAGLAAFVLVRRLPHGRRALTDPDMEPVVLAPDALGDSLAVFGWLGKPSGLWQAAWNALLWVGNIAQTVMSLFERRYYLAGLLVALIIAILVMAQ